MKPKETDVAAAVDLYFRDLGFEVFPEVCTGRGEARADLVAIRGPLVVWVECKTSLSLHLLEQAHSALSNAHRVYAAYPSATRATVRGRYFAERAARAFGIGMLVVAKRWGGPDGHSWEAKERRPAAWNRRPKYLDATRAACVPETRCVEPGQAGGGYHTPFRGTMRAVRAFAAANPGASTREVVDGISHHYARDSNARSGLANWGGNAEMMKRHGIRVEQDGKGFRWYAADVLEIGGAE